MIIQCVQTLFMDLFSLVCTLNKVSHQIHMVSVPTLYQIQASAYQMGEDLNTQAFCHVKGLFLTALRLPDKSRLR